MGSEPTCPLCGCEQSPLRNLRRTAAYPIRLTRTLDPFQPVEAYSSNVYSAVNSGPLYADIIWIRALKMLELLYQCYFRTSLIHEARWATERLL